MAHSPSIAERRNLYVRLAAQCGADEVAAQAAATYRYDRASDDKPHTAWTAASVTGIPEARIAEIDYAVEQRVEQIYGVAAVHDGSHI